MKKLLFSILSIASIIATAQTSILLTNTSSAGTITPNSNINLVTTAGANTNIVVDIKNTSGATKSYNVKRYDIQLNSAGSTTASAYFCFAGNCYGAGTMVSPTPITLNSNQSASQLSGAYNMLIADLDEATSVGASIVKYTFINTTTASDSVQFTLKYNAPLGVNEITNTISSFDVFPNPATDFTSFKINSKTNTDAKFEVYNALGSSISNKTIALNEGKNKIDYNVESLSSGIYFASIKIGTSTITKKFIVK